MPSTAPTPRARELGRRLREYRQAAGLTTRDLGERLGRSHSDVSKWETGRAVPSEEALNQVFGALTVPKNAREDLRSLAQTAKESTFVASGLGAHFAALLEYEQAAAQITHIAPLLVPGLLQTPEYTRAITTADGASLDLVEREVGRRAARREALARRSTQMRLHAIIGEWALRDPACEPDIMIDQLRYLLTWTERDDTTIQVLPLGTGYTSARHGAISVMEFDDTTPVVHLDHYRAVMLFTNRRAVDHQRAAVMLRNTAMAPAATAEYIGRLADEMKRGTEHGVGVAQVHL